ncbi:MAG: 50S ribosomal protein L3 N(5)-glutamine methyltransferase [Rubrivivax sp.]|nr:50S ribosomal protein L3 N(5)-glutamine methyltransferase [Rubrivivax sp.]
MTVFECVQQASRQLEAAGVAFGHGTTNAFDEAAWLVLWRLGLPLDALDEPAGRVLTAAEQRQVQALIDERIRTRRPAAYLTGEAWLQGVPFFVDERTIVPRSLIAEPLAAGDIDALMGREPARVLDLCTGNGSLAVLSAMAWPDATVVGTDLSAAALEVAARNAARHGLSSRIELRRGDGLAALLPDERFDLVLCNPPYVNAASMAALPAEFRAEPALALAGGTDGMDFVRPLLHGIATHLAPGGVLVLEVGHEREHLDAAFPRLEAVWLDTSAGGDAVLALARDALPTTETSEAGPR